MDNPDLIVACVVGDGEAESGPTATAWHGYKYLDPAESGAVIPIVHVNGFKISERTIYGTMDDLELCALFRSAALRLYVLSLSHHSEFLMFHPSFVLSPRTVSTKFNLLDMKSFANLRRNVKSLELP